jgi:hypothetical protein
MAKGISTAPGTSTKIYFTFLFANIFFAPASNSFTTDWFHAVYTITTKALAFTLVPLVSKMFFDDCAII